MTVNRQKVIQQIIDWRYHGDDTVEACADRILALLTPDPRITLIQELCNETELGVAYSNGNAVLPEWVPQIRTILDDV